VCARPQGRMREQLRPNVRFNAKHYSIPGSNRRLAFHFLIPAFLQIFKGA